MLAHSRTTGFVIAELWKFQSLLASESVGKLFAVCGQHLLEQNIFGWPLSHGCAQGLPRTHGTTHFLRVCYLLGGGSSGFLFMENRFDVIVFMLQQLYTLY